MRARRLLTLGLCALLSSTLLACIPGVVACAAQPGARVDLRFLLLGTDEQAPALRAWESAMRAEGVPYDRLLFPGATLSAAGLQVSPTHARYQAVVHATRDGAVSLPGPQQALLDAYLDRFGIREVIAYGTPPGVAPGLPRNLAGETLEVTPQGAQWMGGVKQVEVIGAFGNLPTATATASVQALVTGPGGAPVVATQRVGAHDELYVSVQTAPELLHFRLLSHGLLNWAAGGARLGLRRYYLAVQIDDVFLPNFRWDSDRNQTAFHNGDRTIVMSPADVEAAAKWSRERDVRLDLVANFGGTAFGSLIGAALQDEEAFGWVNHTFSHLDFDEATAAQMQEQITENVACAQKVGIDLDDPRELVTGEHSGLQNPALVPVLSQTGINYVASDASRQPDLSRLGTAWAVPRHPINLFYDVGTREELLDEYNFRYLEDCEGDFCLREPVDWEEYLDTISRQVLEFVSANDPRTLYVHQSNLAEERLLLQVLDAVLKRYRAQVTMPLVQPTLTESGAELRRQQLWADAVADGAVEAYRRGDAVVVTTSREIDVPVTGAGAQTYGDERSGWVPAVPGQPLELQVA